MGLITMLALIALVLAIVAFHPRMAPWALAAAVVLVALALVLIGAGAESAQISMGAGHGQD